MPDASDWCACVRVRVHAQVSVARARARVCARACGAGKDLAGLYYGDSAHGNAAHLGGALYGAAAWFLLRRRPFHY